ncbi:MAG: calcium/sodium antiporter [Gemmatimonadota bacterium]
MPELVVEILWFVGGLTAVIVGADTVVRGGSRIAERLGIPELVIGLTVVAFGTSAPELVISGGAAIREEPGLAVGNVMGSTVANVGLIVGIGALISPIEVHRRLLVRESPLLILVLAIVMALSWNDALGRLDGFALLAGFAVYLWFLFRWAAQGETTLPDVDGSEGEAPVPRPAVDWGLTLFGLVALPLGAHYMLEGANSLAVALGVPDAVIGATMVAIGTSLPELASTTAAAFRGMGDIAIGNVIGSNVFNLGLVLGAAALLRPLELAPMQVVQQVVPALVFCVGLIPLAYTGMRVDRWEGLLLLTAYGGFVWWVLV